MEKNRTENDVIGMKESRFSGEERARMAEENTKERNSRKINTQQEHKNRKQKKDEKQNPDDTKKKDSGKKDSRRSERSSGSRNDRVKNSAEQRKKDKKRQNYLVISMMFIVVIALVGVLSATVLRINTVEVTGTDNYSDTSVLDAAGLKSGDSMVLINIKAMEDKIETLLPFIEEAAIEREWPDKIKVSLEDAKPALAIDTGDGYVIMNNSCKVLTDSASSPGNGVAIIKGLTLSQNTPGKQVVFSGDISTSDFTALTNALEESGIKGISSYDLSSISSVSIIIDHRIEVKLGTLAGAAQRFNFLKQVVEETVASDKKNAILIDVTDDGTAYVRNKDDNNVNFGEGSFAEETTTANEESTVFGNDETTVPGFG